MTDRNWDNLFLTIGFGLALMVSAIALLDILIVANGWW